jgi:hypothetical protein
VIVKKVFTIAFAGFADLAVDEKKLLSDSAALWWKEIVPPTGLFGEIVTRLNYEVY